MLRPVWSNSQLTKKLRGPTGVFEGGNRYKMTPYEEEKRDFSSRQCTVSQVVENGRKNIRILRRTTYTVTLFAILVFQGQLSICRPQKIHAGQRCGSNVEVKDWPILWPKINYSTRKVLTC